jgi:hypothetical protein
MVIDNEGEHRISFPFLTGDKDLNLDILWVSGESLWDMRELCEPGFVLFSEDVFEEDEGCEQFVLVGGGVVQKFLYF